MTSKAKVASNRRNAQRSTGPRTADGKLASAQNALRHGLLSTQIVLPDEDIDEYTAFRKLMTAPLATDDPLQGHFADLFIANAWKLRRAGRHIALVTTQRAREANAGLHKSRSDGESLALGLIKDATGADVLSKLNRYERAYERGMYRALHELQRLQTMGRGDNVPPPSELHVQISFTE